MSNGELKAFENIDLPVFMMDSDSTIMDLTRGTILESLVHIFGDPQEHVMRKFRKNLILSHFEQPLLELGN
jgi:hypothetical protein